MMGQSMVNDGPTIGYWAALLERCEKEVHERATARRRGCGWAALRVRCVKSAQAGVPALLGRDGDSRTANALSDQRLRTHSGVDACGSGF
jgi:hypothetical protein